MSAEMFPSAHRDCSLTASSLLLATSPIRRGNAPDSHGHSDSDCECLHTISDHNTPAESCYVLRNNSRLVHTYIFPHVVLRDFLLGTYRY